MNAVENTMAIVSPSGDGGTRLAGNGAFGAVHSLKLPGYNPASLDAQLGAVDLARRAGAGWMLALGAGERLADDSLDLFAPGLDLFDAIFGSAHVPGSSEAVSRLSRLAFDTADRLPHALLNWWMPDAHLVRTETAARSLHRVAAKSRHWRLDYLFDLWDSARCLKSAQPVLHISVEPQPVDADGKAEILRRLLQQPVYLPVIHGDATYHLPYTGRNAGIEREQSRGLFFEAMELEELRKVVRPGARVVDVGANTGNHTVFFAGPMRASSVTPFEPLPAAADVLRATVARNGLRTVDLGKLLIGVSDRAGRARLVFSERGGLGATGLRSDPHGDIVVATLDSMLSAPVDLLKIDVEGMEMQVLSGAEDTIGRWRPMIFIEVANHNTSAFCAWLKTARYSVSRIFTDKGHANYLLVPMGPSV
ncbi:MAG: FkbM family methyltransferase [Hyphomicrobiales bacterium]|nr:FkbM family methyltransferase [Hyphomicrobiales bacterium]